MKCLFYLYFCVCKSEWKPPAIRQKKMIVKNIVGLMRFVWVLPFYRFALSLFPFPASPVLAMFLKKFIFYISRLIVGRGRKGVEWTSPPATHVGIMLNVWYFKFLQILVVLWLYVWNIQDIQSLRENSHGAARPFSFFKNEFTFASQGGNGNPINTRIIAERNTRVRNIFF